MVYLLAALVSITFVYWVGSLALLYSRKSAFAQQWNVHNTQADLPNQLVYVAIGDSTAQGLGARSIKQSYPHLVSAWLQKQTGRPVKLINLSLSGAKISHAVQVQLPEIYRLEVVHIVTVAIGANDIQSFNAESFETDMKMLIRTLPKESYVASLPCFNGRAKKHNWKVTAANGLLQKALEKTNHHFVDLYSETKPLGAIWYFAADWFHPNARSYNKWAFTFEKAMAERMPELVIAKK